MKLIISPSDCWMAPLTQWTWVWANSRKQWWPGSPGGLQSMGSRRVTRLSDWTTTLLNISPCPQHPPPTSVSLHFLTSTRFFLEVNTIYSGLVLLNLFNLFSPSDRCQLFTWCHSIKANETLCYFYVHLMRLQMPPDIKSNLLLLYPHGV